MIIKPSFSVQIFIAPVSPFLLDINFALLDIE